ncbi:hypothetical protein [Phytohabitans kaempferiae]|uniref:Uncharacterized protein n=1 Tax=Phytohabitans kaempferiae TaxID=1620943 RepID=A0ABV6M9Q3_9ACTN
MSQVVGEFLARWLAGGDEIDGVHDASITERSLREGNAFARLNYGINSGSCRCTNV